MTLLVQLPAYNIHLNVNGPVTYLLILQFVAPEEGLFCKPKYRAIFCFIHFFFTLRISYSVSSFL